MAENDETTVSRPISGGHRLARDRASLIVLQGEHAGEMYKILLDRSVIGRGRSAHISLTDTGVSRAHAEITVRGGKASIRDLGSRNGTYCNGVEVTEHPLQNGDKIQLGESTVLRFAFHDELDDSFQRQMYDAALRDGVTGAFNKRYFVGQLLGEMGYARRHELPLSILFAGIDEFKSIHDRYGRATSDQVLKKVAGAVARLLRAEDVLARWGAETFAILCRDVALDGAAVLAERLREAVRALTIRQTGLELRPTVSVGVAAVSLAIGAGPEEAILAGERALARARESGADRIWVAGA